MTLLVRVLQRHRTSRDFVYTWERFLGIDLRDYGIGEVWQSAVCKPETQEASGVVWWGLRAWEQGRLKSRSKSLRRYGMSPLQQGGRQQKGANSSFSHLRLCAGPPWPGWYPPTLESSLPAEGTDSNARLLQEHRHRHTQKCLIWAPCGQSELTIRNDFKTVNVLLQNFSSPSLC